MLPYPNHNATMVIYVALIHNNLSYFIGNLIGVKILCNILCISLSYYNDMSCIVLSLNIS